MAYNYAQSSVRLQQIDELINRYPSCRALNPDRSVFDLPLDAFGFKGNMLRISLPPRFPQERPVLTVVLPLSNPSIDNAGRVHCRHLSDWETQAGAANLTAAVIEALRLLTGGQASGSGTSPSPVTMADSPTALVAAAAVDLGATSTRELEALVTNADGGAAYKSLLSTWLSRSRAAQALAEIRRTNMAIAEENVGLLSAIEEGRNQVAVVRVSEYTVAEAELTDLRARQEAVVAALGRDVLFNKLKAAVDAADKDSVTLLDEFYAGNVAVDSFVERYLAKRTAFHGLDLRRQAAESMA